MTLYVNTVIIHKNKIPIGIRSSIKQIYYRNTTFFNQNPSIEEILLIPNQLDIVIIF